MPYIQKGRACAVVLFLFFLLPINSWGEEKKNYIVLKGGTYTFMDSLKDANFSTGFDAELAYGHYVLSNLVLEGAAGYVHDGVNKGYGNDIKVIPVTLTAKVVLPLARIEPFVGAGIGLYFTKFHGKVEETVTDVSKTLAGGHVAAGSYYNISSSLFAGVEGKYVVTEEADFGRLRTSLNGFSVTANVGCRF